MKKNTLLYLPILLIFLMKNIHTTPSTQIWIPSTDIQPVNTFHLGIDNYFTIFTKKIDGAYSLPVDIGLTYGVLKYVEIGIDLFEPTDYPISFNAKIGLPEDTYLKGLPSVAVGGYYFGTEKDVTDINVVYGLLAKTIKDIGRFSAGYYFGNEKLLVNLETLEKDNAGLLASFDRSIPEISDKLWFAVDYQGGKNSLGALSFGFSWLFSDKVSLIVGYNIYNSAALKNTLTTQLDINF